MTALAMDELRHRLDGIRNLPTLPGVFQNVQAAVRDPRTSARDIGDVVAEDSALTARILKMVNSAFYGLSREVSTIDQAVVILGLRELERIVLATTVLKMFPRGGKQASFDPNEFWKHSLGTAIAAREISRRTKIGEPQELFTMGLLHDLGKLVLDLFFTQLYEPVLSAASAGTSPIIDMERMHLGFTHADVGAILAAKWGLPMRLVEVIQHHHDPAASDVCAEQAAVVNFADLLCRVKQWGDPGDPHIPALADGVRELVPLPMDQLAPLMGLIEEYYRDGVALLNVA